MGIPTVSSNLYRVDPKTGEKITTPDSSEESAHRNDINDTFANVDADEEKILQGMKDLVNFARFQKLEGAVDDEVLLLGSQGIRKIAQQTAYGSNGESFYVTKWYNTATNETYDSDYMSVIEKIARGGSEQEHLINYAYMDNLTSDILSFFGTAATESRDAAYIKERLNAVIEEVRQNIAAGKENPTENLQTKFTMNGADWTLSDLLGAVDALQKACSASWQGEYNTIGSFPWMNYKHYAYLGMAKGYISQYAAENLNKEQADSLNSVMQARIDAAIARNNKFMEEHQAETDAQWEKILSSPDYPQYKNGWDERRKYYSYGAHSGIATNKQVIDKIMDIFASVASGKPMSSALNEYYELMKPVYNSLNQVPQLCFDSERSDFMTFYNSLYSR